MNFCFFFAIYSASKFQKIAKIRIFAGFCAINSAKMKNSKIPLLSSFLDYWEVPFCKFSSKMVKRWIWSSVLKVVFFNFLVKTLYFWSFFEKNNLKIATPPLFFDHFTWKFAKRYFLRLQKTWPERIFEFSLFLLFIARQNSKNSKIAFFAGFCAIYSAKMKN